jgi:hypothetical protein
LLLLQKGAKINAMDINAEYVTLPHIAAESGQEQVVELLEKGAGINVKDGDDGTALHKASQISSRRGTHSHANWTAIEPIWEKRMIIRDSIPIHYHRGTPGEPEWQSDLDIGTDASKPKDDAQATKTCDWSKDAGCNTLSRLPDNVDCVFSLVLI